MKLLNFQTHNSFERTFVENLEKTFVFLCVCVCVFFFLSNIFS